ncbi:hypothetical protein HYE54_01020 [Aggregatibacter actinomycetemcomitans]|uniref:hypothetical protein n=1 Tax=Aggregatibacter actinomycetemcomitans TaxID=714 RepID=UPI00197B3A2F|nr:hypothetical protein [Aggregatibacter actinomycetemcomitans]MBN6067400.1 hypothetical protein [Aggregatibacter actinomycetemcomitans]MBN6086098.1 hypothetical protein [Aggregatibacter actinomycetemcomitans]
MAQLPRIQSQFIAISGGMDLTTPPIAKANSEAISALNVQPNYGGGFSRIEGYECIDGKTIPSEMTYAVLIVGIIPDKERFRNQAFVHAGKQYRIIDVLDNAFVVAFLKPINVVNGVSFTVNGVSFTAHYVNSSIDGQLEDDLNYRGWAFQLGVDSVSAVPGVDKIRGVAELNGEVIAFRDNGEKCGTFISSNNGWSPVPASYLVKLKNLVKPENLLDNSNFTSGSVKGVIHSATLSPDSKSGYVVLSQSVTVNQPLQINGITVATVETCDLVTLSKGKDWQFIYHNFYGGANTFYAYGCNGEQVIEVRPNGVIIPILVNNDNPQYICAHRNHLFASFPGGQLGHSLVGRPNKWSVLLGSEQFGLGDEITALSSTTGGVLIIGCRSKTAGLYGSGRDNWAMKDISSVGIHPNTLQTSFVPIAISKNGITRIDQSEKFGDFKLSETDANRKLGFDKQYYNIVYSSTKPKANQIRFYSAEGRHVCIMFNPDGSTRSTFFTYPEPVKGLWQSPDNVYMAFDDGKLYRQSDNCHSFSGKEIDWIVKMAFNHCGSPTLVKSWHSAELQATTEGKSKLSYRFDLDYNSNYHAATLGKELQIAGGGGRWNDSFWNDFLWSAEDYSTPTFHLSGYSRNIALSFSGKSIYSPQFEISGLILNYITRRNYRV